MRGCSTSRRPASTCPPIPTRPTPAEIAAARALICEDLLGDFPFVSPAERAHAVALLLLGFLRGMIDGPTPLHLIEKPTPGTGATLMVDAIATILTGAGASVMTEGRDDDEWRKRVTAKLRQIPAILLIDNLRAEARQLRRRRGADRALLGGPHPRRSPRWRGCRSAASGSPPATTPSSPTRWRAAWCASGSMPMSSAPGSAPASAIPT